MHARSDRSDTQPSLVIISWYSPDMPDSGERMRLRYLSGEFSTRLNVTWLILDASDRADGPTPSMRPPAHVSRAYRVSSWDYAASTLHLHSLERHVLSSRRMVSWVRAQLDSIRPDAILVNQPYAWGALPPEWRHAAVLDTHNVNSARLGRVLGRMSMSDPRRVPLWLQVQLSRRFERAYSETSREVWVVSPEDRESLGLKSKARCRVVPNGALIDPDSETRYLLETERPQLLFFGSLGYSANVDALRRIVRWLEVTPDHFSVTIAGSGADTETIRLATSRPELKYVGRLDNPPAAMKHHHALIAPLREGGGSRLKILEAMANRLPVMATEVAAEGIGLQPDVHYLRIDSARDLQSSISTLRNHAAVCNLVDSAWSIVQDFQWSSISATAADVLIGSTAAVRKSGG